MNRRLIPLLLLVFITGTAPVKAQFLKKLKNKVEKQLDNMLQTGEEATPGGDASEAMNTEDSGEKEKYLANYPDFIAGSRVIFADSIAADEIPGKKPSKWSVTNFRKTDNSEIVDVNGEKMIRLAERQGIAPLIPGKEKDYMPENFTIEFDASFSVNAFEQRYYINFYDVENQNDFVEWDVRNNELTLTTYGVTDNMTEGTLNGKLFQAATQPVWRHIAISYHDQTIDVYYDGQHVFRKNDVKGNMIGLDISRSDFGTDDRYIKNILIATN